MPVSLIALQGALRGDAQRAVPATGVANPAPTPLSPLALARRLGWPRLPLLGEIHDELAAIEASIRAARFRIRESIDLGEADNRAIRRVLPDLERGVRLVPTGILLLKAMSR